MNQIDLIGQTAVVTGGAQGIGLAVAARLVRSGAKVILWDRNTEMLDRALQLLGTPASARVLDVSDHEAVALAARDAKADVDILVHSAGITGNNAPLDTYDLAEWRRVIEIDLNATFYVNQAIVPLMRARNYGRIVNISSIAGKEGNPNAAAYSAAKAGVIAMTKALGKELAAFDISVNCVTPAAAQTGLLAELTPEFIAYMLSRIPRGRFLEVEEAASMIAWLVSRENSFSTATVFDLSGGRATY